MIKMGLLLFFLAGPVFAGSFFVNFTVFDTDERAVVHAVDDLGWDAFVAVDPQVKDRVVVCERQSDGQDDNLGLELGKKLSTNLGKPVLHTLVHDSDILYQRLILKDLVIFEFDSWPGYFEGKDRKAEVKGIKDLARAARKNPAEVRALLTSDYTFAEELLEREAKLLGLPRTVGLGYSLIQSDKGWYEKEGLRIVLLERK